MNNPYQLRGYIVNPISTQSIRDRAIYAREVLNLPIGAVDMEQFLERLISYGITIDIVDDDDMPGFSFHSEACCIPETATIYLTAETYRKACLNDPRTRFTIFHELGHLILGHRRELHRANLPDVKPYMDSEWQADQFAAEILMPLDVIFECELSSAHQIKTKFGVSEAAATKRYTQLEKNGYIKK